MITSSTGFCIDRVFSTLDNKSKVLAVRRKQSPFPSATRQTAIKVNSQVVLPSDTRINFRLAAHNTARPVRTLADTVEKYRQRATESSSFNDSVSRREIRNAWMAYRDASARGQRRNARHLGRFAIRRQLASAQSLYEYFTSGTRSRWALCRKAGVNAVCRSMGQRWRR
jgi:hypothetical protein